MKWSREGRTIFRNGRPAVYLCRASAMDGNTPEMDKIEVEEIAILLLGVLTFLQPDKAT